jgi:uncharacterized membrane protein
MMMWRGGFLLGHWIVGFLFLLLVLFAIGMLISMVMRGQRSEGHPPVDSAFQALRERFARGEISQAEFEAAKKTLGY